MLRYMRSRFVLVWSCAASVLDCIVVRIDRNQFGLVVFATTVKKCKYRNLIRALLRATFAFDTNTHKAVLFRRGANTRIFMRPLCAHAHIRILSSLASCWFFLGYSTLLMSCVRCSIIIARTRGSRGRRMSDSNLTAHSATNLISVM